MNTAVLSKGNENMNKKIVSISSKRQITIPQKFFTELGFTTEAECVLRGNEIIIRPVRLYRGGEFAEIILSELISEGFSGDELLEEFKARQSKIRPAVEKMIEEAENVANGNGKYSNYDDVFGEEEQE